MLQLPSPLAATWRLLSTVSRPPPPPPPAAGKALGAGGAPSPAAMASAGAAPAAPATWAAAGLAPWLVRQCQSLGLMTPTAVQANCIPQVLARKDVMGCAQTGSGKTAAFALPILHLLSQDPYGVFAVVVTPTRELAVQIWEQVGHRSSLKQPGRAMRTRTPRLRCAPLAAESPPTQSLAGCVFGCGSSRLSGRRSTCDAR